MNICCLAVSLKKNTEDDDSCLCTWNLSTGERLSRRCLPFNGQVASLAWFSHGKDKEAFAVGLGDGHIFVYIKNPENVRVCISKLPPNNNVCIQSQMRYHFQVKAHPDAVVDIKFDRRHSRLASCGASSFQVWCIADSGTHIHLFPHLRLLKLFNRYS